MPKQIIQKGIVTRKIILFRYSCFTLTLQVNLPSRKTSSIKSFTTKSLPESAQFYQMFEKLNDASTFFLFQKIILSLLPRQLKSRLKMGRLLMIMTTTTTTDSAVRYCAGLAGSVCDKRGHHRPVYVKLPAQIV